MNARAIAGCLLAASLAACVTPQPPAPPAPVATPANEESRLPAAPERPQAPALPRVVMIPGPPAERFVGQPLAEIESVIGVPALVRREGDTEFRRYDVTEDCRAFVVAQPEGGTVLSVDTGAAMQGAPAPRFEDCTAREGFAGS